MNEINPTLIEVLKAKKIPVESFSKDQDVNLIEGRYVDSLGFLEIISEVESIIGLELDLFDHDPNEFTSVQGLSKIINAKQS